MKTLIIIFAFIISGFAAKAQETAKDSPGTISVEIKNLTSDNGKIVYGIYTKDSFMKKPSFSKTANIEDGKSNVTFTGIPEGEYAVICFHDKNDNDRMDFETNGMPKEDYGISNNKLNLYGPPTWDDGKFSFDGSTEEINIRF